MPTLPAKIARPPRGQDIEDWRDWAEEVERVINLLLAHGETWGPITNVITDRSFNADATTVDELADVVGTLVADLQAKGVVQA